MKRSPFELLPTQLFDISRDVYQVMVRVTVIAEESVVFDGELFFSSRQLFKQDAEIL